MNQGWRKDYVRYRSYFLNVMGRYRERTDIKVYLEILLSLITVSIFSIFALRPTLLTIAGLIKEIEGKKDILSTMNEKISNLSKAQVLLDQMRQEVALLKTSVPTSPQQEVFARQIEGLSARHGIPVTRLSLSGATIFDKNIQSAGPEGKAGQIIYSLNATTPIDNYPALANLTLDLENLRIPPIINKLTINITNDTGVTVLSTVLDGKLQYLPSAEGK